MCEREAHWSGMPREVPGLGELGDQDHSPGERQGLNRRVGWCGDGVWVLGGDYAT